MTKVKRWEQYIFWYGAIISLGLLFVMAWVWDGITPRELIRYINDKETKK